MTNNCVKIVRNQCLQYMGKKDKNQSYINLVNTSMNL